jgi:hypothetical protein
MGSSTSYNSSKENESQKAGGVLRVFSAAFSNRIDGAIYAENAL